MNIPPDRRGLIHENDIKRLNEFREYQEKAFSINTARGGRAWASSSRRGFGADKAIDGHGDTYWAAEDSALEAILEIHLDKPEVVNAVLIQEYIPLGQRVRSFTVQVLSDGQYDEVARGTTMGNRRIVRLEDIVTDKHKITILANAYRVAEYFVDEAKLQNL